MGELASRCCGRTQGLGFRGYGLRFTETNLPTGTDPSGPNDRDRPTDRQEASSLGQTSTGRAKQPGLEKITRGPHIKGGHDTAISGPYWNPYIRYRLGLSHLRALSRRSEPAAGFWGSPSSWTSLWLLSLSLSLSLSLHICIDKYTCRMIYEYIYMYIYRYIHIYVCMHYACMHACVCMYV